jgi:hypothetical protein
MSKLYTLLIFFRRTPETEFSTRFTAPCPSLSVPMDRLSTPVVALISLLIAICSQVFRTYARLKHVPGPFWAKFTNWQRVLWVKSMRSQDIYASIHEKYGEFVRIGPNAVSISDPAAIPEVYPMRAGFPKVRRARHFQREGPQDILVDVHSNRYDGEECLYLTRCRASSTMPLCRIRRTERYRQCSPHRTRNNTNS